MNLGPHPSKMDTEATAAQADVPDLDLVKKAQEGDSAAFDELVGRYRNRIFGMIYNMVHNEQDAWDLAQDSFLKAWKSIARFRGQSSFYTWLYRIVMNVTIDSLRKKQITGAGAEFDDAVQLKEIDPASRTVPHADALPLVMTHGWPGSITWSIRKSAAGSTPPSNSFRRSIGRSF